MLHIHTIVPLYDRPTRPPLTRLTGFGLVSVLVLHRIQQFPILREFVFLLPDLLAEEDYDFFLPFFDCITPKVLVRLQGCWWCVGVGETNCTCPQRLFRGGSRCRRAGRRRGGGSRCRLLLSSELWLRRLGGGAPGVQRICGLPWLTWLCFRFKNGRSTVD